MIKLRPDKALQYYLTDYIGGISNSRREFTGGPEGVLKPAKTAKEVIERYFVANKSLFDVQSNMRRHMKNAKKLGLDKKDILTTFEKRGRGKDGAYLERGLFNPFFPSKNIQEKFFEIAAETGGENPFKQALPVIRKMYKDFVNQNMDGNFKFTLDDYMPKPAAGPQSALPQTPMPNPSVIGQVQPQPMTTDQGLTPTEMALLSPEEQQIRLRQRGLTS
jgi:hypothetical protein